MALRERIRRLTLWHLGALAFTGLAIKYAVIQDWWACIQAVFIAMLIWMIIDLNKQVSALKRANAFILFDWERTEQARRSLWD